MQIPYKYAKNKTRDNNAHQFHMRQRNRMSTTFNTILWAPEEVVSAFFNDGNGWKREMCSRCYFLSFFLLCVCTLHYTMPKKIRNSYKRWGRAHYFFITELQTGHCTELSLCVNDALMKFVQSRLSTSVCLCAWERICEFFWEQWVSKCDAS